MVSRILAGAALATSVAAKVQMAGVNIAGFDFGCGNTEGVYTAADVTPPLASQGNVDGIGQMNHFVQDDGLNVFRLPVCWQYLLADQLGANLDSTAIGVYDELVQGCLSTGASCIVDIHNYARWENQVIGQSNGAVTDDHIVSTWTQLAQKYASESQIIFGVMNEPHDLDITTWAATVQKVVTAIRNAGAANQMILLPGTVYTSLGAFQSDGSADALVGITNPDGSTSNLVFDVHQYLDSDFSGTHTECTTDGTDNVNSLAAWLSGNGRMAFLTETGGGSTDSCYTDVCGELGALNNNAGQFSGWVGWAAGAFQTDYELSQVPTYANGVWTDTGIVQNCIAGQFK